jgi:CCR4-NOT transcription complex subunit 3
LKKVSEGVDLFESIHEKLMASTNATQKDKLETDLKTQIKKLQRLRDQIKTWLTSNDVKDKTQLMDNRKLIESVGTKEHLQGRFSHLMLNHIFLVLQQMERFKALEKEMKTKAFSKEGLIAATRLDPQEKAKLEARQTIEEFVDSLSRQIEQAEAEIEILQASSTGGRGKKSGKSSSAGNSEGRIAELERLNERRSWHISKLEAVMRLLENGKLSVEQVTELKEDVSYFVESNQVRSSIAGLEGLSAERVGVYVCLSRKRTLKRTKASMRTSTLMKKKMVWV